MQNADIRILTLDLSGMPCSSVYFSQIMLIVYTV